MSKFRKAIIAAVGAVLAALTSAYAQDQFTDWRNALVMALIAGVTVGLATYSVPNAQPLFPREREH